MTLLGKWRYTYMYKTQNDNGLDKRKITSTFYSHTSDDQHKIQNGDYFYTH